MSTSGGPATGSVPNPHPLPQVVLTLVIGLSLLGCSRPDPQPASNMAVAREAKKERAELRANIRKIEPFFKVMGRPANSDWLASHNEPGQTFEEYLDADPTKPTKERQKIYVLPLGTFNAKQQKIIEITAGYLEVFYDLPVEQMPPRSLQKPAREQGRNTQRSNHAPANTRASAPSNNTRRSRLTGQTQIRTGYIIDDILTPMLPKDAAALIAFTTDDLYPDETMNYVFGQASLENRVGVWSLSRLDDNTDELGFLRRTLKIAAHETGHMFSMRHCTKFECLMSGTNNLSETDRRPIDACPECTAKICWLSDADQSPRYTRLSAFCRKNGLNKEADEFIRKAEAVNAR